MTFYGQTFTGCGKPFAIEADDSELVHISSVFVKAVGDNSKFWDFKIGNEAGQFFTVARLSKDKPIANIDYFLTTGTLVQLGTEGSAGDKTTFDVSGYVEPMGGMSDSGSEGSEQEAESETEVDIQQVAGKALLNLAAKAKAAAGANSEESSDDEQEEDTDDEPETAATATFVSAEPAATEQSDEDNSEEGSSSDSDSGSDEDDEEEEEEEEQPAVVVPVKTAKPAKAAAAVVENKKRKATEPAAEQPSSKKGVAGPAGDYEKAIVAHLKSTGGISKIPLIGSKVKKPEGLKTKLGAFIKERPQLFTMTGDSVTLRK